MPALPSTQPGAEQSARAGAAAQRSRAFMAVWLVLEKTLDPPGAGAEDTGPPQPVAKVTLVHSS